MIILGRQSADLNITTSKSIQHSDTWHGLRFMLYSVLAFTVMNAFVKYLESVSAYQIVFFRGFGSFILCLAYLKFKGIPVWGTHRKLLLARGAVGTLSMTLFFLALKEIPFGSAATLRYIAPIFAALFAVVWLKEKISIWQWLCFIAAFVGVIILKGFDTGINPIGLIYILTCAFFSGIVYVIIRQIGMREHPVVIVTYFMGFATLTGAVLSIFHWNPPSSTDWIVLLALGIFGYLGQLFMTKAYQMAPVTTVAPLKYLEAVFALVVGWLWFGESHGFMSLIGIGVIIGSMLLNIFLQQYLKRK